MAERRVQCSVCGGSGKYAYNDVSPCYGCNGHGYIIEQYDDSLPSSYTPSSSGGGGPSVTPAQRKANLLFEEGLNLYKAEDYINAIKKFTQAIYHNSLLKSLAYFYRACCYFCTAEPNRMLEDSTEALKLGLFNEKDIAFAYYMRGFAYGEKHNWKEDCKDQAIADLKKAADLGIDLAVKELAKLGVKYKPNSGGSSSPKKGGFLGLFGKK